jgi:hypothetical protein
MTNWKWKIHYTVEAQGVYFENPIEIKDEKKSIDLNIIFTNVEGTTKDKIQFECLDYKSNYMEEARKETERLVNNVINILAYKFGAFFTEPFIIYEGEFGKSPTRRSAITLYNIENIQLSDVDKQDLKNSLNDDAFIDFLTNNPQEKIYRDIIFSQNKVGNFIALYSLLQEIIGHHSGKPAGQSDTDNFIRSQPNYMRQTDRDSTGRKDKNDVPIKETKYTWLRNQIGHTQSSTDILVVETEIISIYSELVKLILTAKEKYLR